MNLQTGSRPAVLSAAISVILASPALASAPPASSVQLQEIIVTAQRAETNLQQTPISVAAVSGEDLAQQGASTLLDLTSFIPNLQVTSSSLQGAGNGRFAIRGIGQENGTVAAIGLYVDEVYYPTGFGTLMGLFDVDRVEVLRGPQGTLFGRNTIAGAIQYITRKPNDTFGGYVEATGGNFGRADFAGALNVPLGEELAARVAVGYNSRDGFVRDTLKNVDRGADTRKAGRLQFRWTPTTSLTVDLKGEVLANENNGRASIIRGYPGAVFPNGVNDGAQIVAASRVPIPGNTAPTTQHLCPSVIPNGPCIDVTSTGDYQTAGYNAPEYADIDYKSGTLVIGWDLNDAVTLKSITGYSITESDSRFDTDGTPASILQGLGVGVFSETRALSQELQLRLNLFSNRLSWIAGLFYYDEENVTPTGLTALGFTPPTPSDGSELNLTSKAAFTQATYHFTDRLSGIVGLRYSEEESDRRNLDSTPPFSATPFATFRGDFTDTSPQFGVQFQVNDDLMAYGNAAKGFRAGGFSVNRGFAGGAKSYDPENAWTYEIGARMEFLDRRLRVNPTAFFTKWSDIQINSLVRIPEPGAPCFLTSCAGVGPVGTLPQNVGNAEIKGLEADTLFQATDRLTLQASIGYIDSEYTRVSTLLGQIFPPSLGGIFSPTPVLVPNLCLGTNDPTIAQLNPTFTPAQLAPLAAYECTGPSELNRSPKWKFSVGARYTFPLTGGAEIVGSADYGWTDKQRSQVANLDFVPLPSYGVVNARVQYNAPDNRWSLAVFGTNLGDEYYYTGGLDFAKAYTLGTVSWDPARPREYGATLKFNF